MAQEAKTLTSEQQHRAAFHVKMYLGKLLNIAIWFFVMAHATSRFRDCGIDIILAFGLIAILVKVVRLKVFLVVPGERPFIARKVFLLVVVIGGMVYWYKNSVLEIAYVPIMLAILAVSGYYCVKLKPMQEEQRSQWEALAIQYWTRKSKQDARIGRFGTVFNEEYDRQMEYWINTKNTQITMTKLGATESPYYRPDLFPSPIDHSKHH